MLDHLKLMHAIKEKSALLFAPLDDQLAQAAVLWHQMSSDPDLERKLSTARAEKTIPRWHGSLAAAQQVMPCKKPYRVIGIDGSQIYPDRHFNAQCALINIGAVTLTYDHRSAVSVASVPTILSPLDQEIPLTADAVNAMRQEYELAYAVSYCQPDDDLPTIFLFDGSLIFWHLQAYEPELRALFLARYHDLLLRLYAQKKIVAWYISFPKSKELVMLARYVACDYQDHRCDAAQKIDRIVDTDLVNLYLKSGERTIIFEHQSLTAQTYYEPMRPCFYYLQTDEEIARIELPKWLAQDASAVELISACIYDQVNKGYGYPVSLAEAHEQAVVKTPDRELFYHLLTKYGMSAGTHFSISQKSAKKRRMSV
jgi:hypothetical protein